MIKTVVIAALVLVNVFFLAVIIIDTVADARSEREAIENVCTVLRSGGIMISPESIRTGSTLRTMRTAREYGAEAAIARAVLGPTEMTVAGVIYHYESAERGIAVFFSGGDFEIHVNEGVITNTGGTLRTVRRLLRDMGLETSELRSTESPGGETVTAVSAFRGASIINCTIEFYFTGASLETVRGRYVAGAEPAEDSFGISQVGTALIGFLAAVRNDAREDIVCTHILSVEAGFQHHVVGSFGEGVIAPVWLITTDAGLFIVDGATGEIQPAA
jgi:hypothetical protein